LLQQTRAVAPEIARFLAAVNRTESEELRRFIEYLLELTDGVTGRIIDVLRRAASHTLTLRSKIMGLDELQYVGARLPTIINQRT
jgi:hypothetical protein